jgi:hypothetical protein
MGNLYQCPVCKAQSSTPRHTWSSEGCTIHSSHHGGLPGRGLHPVQRAPLVARSTHTASNGPATEMSREPAVTKLQQEQHF